MNHRNPAPATRPERVIVTHGSGSFLGIGVQEIDADRAKALNLREERGVEVTRVEDDSPAAKGGIKTGDVVLEYNGERVEGVEQFMRMVRETPPGREVKLSITRNGSPQQLTMKTGSRKTWMTTRYGERFGRDSADRDARNQHSRCPTRVHELAQQRRRESRPNRSTRNWPSTSV